MSYYVYILESLKDSRLYIGVTSDLEKRIKEHNSGKNRSTKFRRPFTLLYFESFENKSEAYKREWYYKHNGEGNKEMREKARIAKVVTARV